MSCVIWDSECENCGHETYTKKKNELCEACGSDKLKQVREWDEWQDHND